MQSGKYPIVQCGRTHTHGSHKWASADRWCNGVEDGVPIPTEVHIEPQAFDGIPTEEYMDSEARIPPDWSKPTEDQHLMESAIAQQQKREPFTWYDYGVGTDGLPQHMPISHDSQCSGPTEPTPAHHWCCWCSAGHSCTLSLALAEARVTGTRVLKAKGVVVDETMPADPTIAGSDAHLASLVRMVAGYDFPGSTAEIMGVKIARCNSHGRTYEETQLHDRLRDAHNTSQPLPEMVCATGFHENDERWHAHGPHPFQVASRSTYQCPGIKAHGDTAIGGAHDGKPSMYGQQDVSTLTGGQA